MFCGAVDGSIIPPFIVYPQPKPKEYNPLTGGIENSEITYTQKGWMDAETFGQFIEHFDNARDQRSVLLLIDSVSSHVSMSGFEDAKARGTELYRIVPNATHLMQPLDKRVFGPLKRRWREVTRKQSRENPGNPFGKEKFTENLKEAFTYSVNHSLSSIVLRHQEFIQLTVQL